ncbi:sulfatase [Sphingobacterium daejeonense]|uniref:sulfatase family protein n=1 Tax=Sphingobacterium daejeonense TaxID=371142 RepID=UPI0021A88AAD|nr:sulfatase [Sphingobacterium daejeonense]MCT1529383.1 sulfatase [Sphingobacterium daejeonense]
MNRFLTTILFLLAFSSISLGQGKEAQPNIILVFMDDLGYGDLGVTGALDYHTPVLDRMANNGIRFTNFLVPQAVCSASRAALLTGTYPNRMGISGAFMPNAGVGLAPEEESLAEMLKSKGYATQIIGKWHLGNEPEFLPTKQGFDAYYGIPYSNDMWPVGFDGKPAKADSYVAKYPVLPLLQIKVGEARPDTIMKINNLEDQAVLTEKYTRQAVDFIKNNRKKPFFLYLAHSMTHVPIAASKKFRGTSEQGLFGDVMQEIDDSMGQILKSLKDNGIADNTIVIFTSDNGPWLNFGNHNGSSGGFREGKGASWEGGQRVPCIISWPNKIKEGRINNNLTSSMDIYATIAELSNFKGQKNQIDGISFLDQISDSKAPAHRQSMYYYYNKNDLEAVRYKNWKLVFPHKSRSYEGILPDNDGFGGKYNEHEIKEMELYDLRRDPSERYNVIEQNPEILKVLLGIAEEARNDLGDNLTKSEGKNRRPLGRIK